jgi:hypothetical protein
VEAAGGCSIALEESEESVAIEDDIECEGKDGC